MSVIFETLQKLSRSAERNDAGEEGKPPRRNVYALKTVLMSPVAVVLVTVTVFGLGYGLVYGLRQVQRSARMDPAVLAAARAPSAVAQAPPAADAVAERSAPAEPPVVAVQDVPPPPDLSHLPSAGAEAPPRKGPSAGEPVFAGTDLPPTAKMDGQDRQAPLAEAGAVWQPPLSTPSASTGTPGTAFSVPPPPGAQDGGDGFSTAAEAGTEKRPPLIHVENASLSAPPSAPQMGILSPFSDRPRAGHVTPHAGASGGAAPLGASGETDLNLIGDPDAMAPSMSEASLSVEAAAPRPIKRLRIPRYTRLVERLQRAIVSEDQGAADRLLGEFAGIKGKAHPYVIKLKAFRQMQAQDYAAAEVLLEQVLALDRGDRDAQMNMVVVEANTGRLDAARRRLARLSDRFPGDEAVSGMRRQLK